MVEFAEAISRMVKIGTGLADAADREAIITVVNVAVEKCGFATRQDIAEMKAAAMDAAENSRVTRNLVEAHFIPPSTNCVVSPPQLSQILEGLNVKRSSRTIERWDEYLKTDGERGSAPRGGYTLQTRTSLESATAWARSFAAQELSKLHIKVSLDRRFGGRQ